MNRVDIFIEAYKQLEEATRRVYRLGREQSIVAELKRQPRFEEQKSQIQSCADLRNYLQHNSRLGEDYAAEPTDSAIAYVRELTDLVNNRPRCRDICVRKREIIWRRMGDAVMPTMQIMQAQGHSSIPILRDGRVVGVFDERALFAYIAQGNVLNQEPAVTFRDLAPYISVSERNMQSFAFARMNDYVDDVVDIFEKRMENGKRVRLVLLTNTGKCTDRLQGILTPWDIISNT